MSVVPSELSIASVAKYIANAFNFTGEIKFDSTKADGIFRKTASNRKLRDIIPKSEMKFTKFEDGETTLETSEEDQNYTRNE